jgi:hypothetical protein
MYSISVFPHNLSQTVLKELRYNFVFGVYSKTIKVNLSPYVQYNCFKHVAPGKLHVKQISRSRILSFGVRHHVVWQKFIDVPLKSW